MVRAAALRPYVQGSHVTFQVCITPDAYVRVLPWRGWPRRRGFWGRISETAKAGLGFGYRPAPYLRYSPYGPGAVTASGPNVTLRNVGPKKFPNPYRNGVQNPKAFSNPKGLRNGTRNPTPLPNKSPSPSPPLKHKAAPARSAVLRVSAAW